MSTKAKYPASWIRKTAYKEREVLTMRYYYDTEHDKVISSYDLEKEFYFLRKSGETEIETFNQYINECTSKNGSLIYLSHVRQYPFALKFKAYNVVYSIFHDNN